MSITMTELARRMNLSQSTVSLVLNNRDKSRVRPELADQIRRVAKEVGCRPNRAAGQLRRRRSQVIGILVPSTRNFYCLEMVADLHRAVRQRGYSPLFAFWEKDEEQRQALESVLEWNPDALLTFEPALIPANTRIPVASYYVEDPRFDVVKLDLEACVRLILDHVRALGHTRIAWLGNIVSGDERCGIIQALAPEYGLTLKPAWINGAEGVLDYEDGGRMFAALLRHSGGDLPTALLAHHDMAAIGALRCMRDFGYEAPRDFTVIGHDGTHHGLHAIPALTTVRYGAKPSVVDHWVDLLFRRMADPDLPRTVQYVKPTLIVRESSGPPGSPAWPPPAGEAPVPGH